MRGNQKGEAGAEAPGAGGPIAGGGPGACARPPRGRAPDRALRCGPCLPPRRLGLLRGRGRRQLWPRLLPEHWHDSTSAACGAQPRARPLAGAPRSGGRQSACPGARSNDCAGLPCAGLTRGLNLGLWWLRKRALGTWLLAAWSPLLRGDRSVAHFSSGLSVCYF